MPDNNSIEDLIRDMDKLSKNPKVLEFLAKKSAEKRNNSLTGEVLRFKHHETGKDISYELVQGEELREEVCPKDGTNLIYFVVSQVGVGYHCRNCNSIYKSL